MGRGALPIPRAGYLELPAMSLISVVVPCYRHESYVKACLDSVFDQTYSDIELIVLDDCSPDGSFQIVSDLCSSIEYRQRFKRVVCQKNERNLGAHATLNKGVELSSGEYVALLNSDDQYHPGRLAALQGALEKNGGELAFSNYMFMDDSGHGVHGHPLYLELQAAWASASQDYPALSFSFLRKQIALSTGNLIFKRNLFTSIGGFLDLKYCHDWDFVLQSIRYAEPVCVDETLYKYRVHGMNTFNTLGDIAGAESEFVLQRFFSMCEKHGTNNPAAPTEKNWPGILRMLIRKFGMDDLYTRSLTGYLPWHRIKD